MFVCIDIQFVCMHRPKFSAGKSSACIRICMYVCTYRCILIYKCMYIYSYVCVFTLVYTCIRMYIRIYSIIHMIKYVNIHEYSGVQCVRMHLHVFTRLFIFLFIYTYILHSVCIYIYSCGETLNPCVPHPPTATFPRPPPCFPFCCHIVDLGISIFENIDMDICTYI